MTGSPGTASRTEAIICSVVCSSGWPSATASAPALCAARLLAAADGAYVGTCLERGGWGGQIDPARVRSYMDIVRGLEH